MSPTIYIDVTNAQGQPDRLPVRRYAPDATVTPEPAPSPELLDRLRNRLGEL